MSSDTKPVKPAARVAVKVPQPDSLVEVRVTPPDDHFEVKVSPGSELIELLIHPGPSLIEVRIAPPGVSLEGGRRESPPATPDEDEVVAGVSRAEFEAMVEDEEAAEAKKLLAQMDDEERRRPPRDYELPEEIKQILTGEADGPGETAAAEALADAEAPEEPGEGGAAAELPPEAPEEPEALGAPSAEAAEDAEPAPERPEEAPDEGLSEEEPAAPFSGPLLGLEAAGDEPPVMDIGIAAQKALARLSAAVSAERKALSDETGDEARKEAFPGGENPPPPDSTIMVEIYDDGDAPPEVEAEAVAGPPLPEDERMDLSLMEEEEDLVIGPVDLSALEIDLDKSRLSGAGGEQVVKARPMLKVNPANTIVPD